MPTIDAIGAVALRLGITADPALVRRAKERLGRDPGGYANWFPTIARALGLRADFVDATVDEAARLAEEHGPLLATSADKRGFLAVLGRAPGGVRVATGSGLDDEDVLSAAVVAAAVGTTAAERVPWAVIEPLLPLDGLRAEPDGEGPELSPNDRLWRLLRDEKTDVRAVLAYAVAIGLLSLAVPVAVQALVNTVAFGTVVQPVVVLTVLVFVALGFEGLMRVLQASVVEYVQQRTFVRTAVDMTYRLASVRNASISSKYVPELANRFFDVVTVQKAAATLLVDGLGLVLQTAVGMILLAFYHPILLAFDVVLLALVAFVIFGLGRQGIETSIKESKAKYAVASWLEDVARHPTTFRSTATRRFAIDRLDDLAGKYVTYRKKHWKILVRQIAGTKILQAVASAALLGVGGLLVIRGGLTLGQLVAAELIVTSVLGGISKFGKHLESYYDLAAAIDKVGQVVDLPMERGGWERLPRKAQGIEVELRDVVVGDRRAEIDLKLPAGSRVSLRGPNGSGKSQIVDLIFGAGDQPDGGVVTADGMDLRGLDLEDYRAQIAIVRGDEAFEGTITENVVIGREHLGVDDVRHALASVGLLDEIHSLPDGLDTEILPTGAPLSRGQVRRLMIARAIVDKPRLLLLDEALDGLDDDARRKISHCLFRGSKDQGAPWTILLTTHVEEIANLCDTRLRIDSGYITRDDSPRGSSRGSEDGGRS